MQTSSMSCKEPSCQTNSESVTDTVSSIERMLNWNSDDNANVVVIKDFNPFMDTLVLHEPEDASFVWDQVLYPKDAASGDLIIAADKGSNDS